MAASKAQTTKFDINVAIQTGNGPEHMFKAKGETSEDFIVAAADLLRNVAASLDAAKGDPE